MTSYNYRNTKSKVKNARGRKISSTKWLRRHINDPYVQLANKHNYRARSAFKLLEINEKYNLLKPNIKIIDLGCAPGSWSQVLRQKSEGSNIVGVDLKEIEPITGVCFIQGDFLNQEIQQKILERLKGKAELIVSDMAANASGHHETDHLRLVNLLEECIEFCKQGLEKNGNFIAKILQGSLFQELMKTLKANFQKVSTFKPKATYSDSTEFYVICKNFKG